MKKKLVVLTGPRHGTHYFSDVLNVNKIALYGEIMAVNFSKIFLNELKILLKKYNIELDDKDIKFISELRYKDEKMFFYKIFHLYDKLACLNNQTYSGCRVFSYHLNRSKINSIFPEKWGHIPTEIKNEEVKNPLNLIDIVNYVDKIIVLARDSKEVAFSLAQAFNNNLWHNKYRNVKDENLILNKENLDKVVNVLIKNSNFFKEIKEISKQQPDKFLFLNYDEFQSNGWEKVGSFLEVNIDKSLTPFKKNTYNYKGFFSTHAAIKEATEKYNTIFNQ